MLYKGASRGFGLVIVALFSQYLLGVLTVLKGVPVRRAHEHQVIR